MKKVFTCGKMYIDGERKEIEVVLKYSVLYFGTKFLRGKRVITGNSILYFLAWLLEKTDLLQGLSKKRL